MQQYHSRPGRVTLPYEHGLLSIHRVTQGTRDDILAPCLLCSELFRIVARFSEKDVLIIHEILKHRTLSATARSLAPGRPSYRTYIQKRLKRYRSILRDALENSLFGALLEVMQSVRSHSADPAPPGK